MAIQLMDNFQFYGTNASLMLQGLWWSNIYSVNDESRIIDDPDPNADTDSKAFKFAQSATGASVCRLAVPTAGQQMGVGCRLWFTQLPATNNAGAGLQFNNSGNGTLYLVHVTPTGALRLIRRDGGWTTSGDTVVDTTTGPVITAGAWYHWEFYMDTATGAYEVRVEGVTVLSGTDASHHTDSLAIFVLVESWETTSSADGSRYAKDLIIWDDTGTQNNTFIGPVTVYSLQVDGDVSDTNVTPSTGADIYAVMDELTPNDADYAEMGATPAEMIMTFENVPADVIAIRAAQTIVRAQKTDGGDATMQVGLISSASEDTGSDDACSTSFRYHADVSELDPNTATAWTPTTLNAATIRINRTL